MRKSFFSNVINRSRRALVVLGIVILVLSLGLSLLLADFYNERAKNLLLKSISSSLVDLYVKGDVRGILILLSDTQIYQPNTISICDSKGNPLLSGVNLSPGKSICSESNGYITSFPYGERSTLFYITGEIVHDIPTILKQAFFFGSVLSFMAVFTSLLLSRALSNGLKHQLKLSLGLLRSSILQMRPPDSGLAEFREIEDQIQNMIDKVRAHSELERELESQLLLTSEWRRVAHDLQSPIGAIAVVAEGLEPNSPGRDLLGQVTKRLKGMVAQLGASSEKSIAQKVHLRSIIESALIIFMASHRKLIENVVFTPDLKAIDAVEIDRHFGNQLARVVTNLLNNAAEALVDTDPLREIKLTLWHSNGVLGIKVIDSGRGMSAETLSQALTGGYTSKTKGNGIGLSSSREWVTRNHGSFHIDSKLGHGTEITIEVPLERK